MWGSVLKCGAAALAAAGVGFAVGVSLPEIRKKLKEEQERQKAAREAELAQGREQERAELEQVAKMAPEAQVQYFERRRIRDEKKREEEAVRWREQAAREGLGGLLMMVGMRFKALAFLILMGQQIADSITSVTGWLAGVLRRAPGASPLAAAA